MTRPYQEQIRYEPQQSHGVEKQYSSFQYVPADRKEQHSYIVGSPPSFVIHNGQSTYSPMNSQLIGSPPINYPPPHFVQGHAPIITRPLIQGQVIGSTMNQSINPTGTTIIQAPMPIIKPVVYRTVETNQHQETIQQLVNEYTMLYKEYQELKKRVGKEPQEPITVDNGKRSKMMIETKRKMTQTIFQDMFKKVDSMLNSVFEERIKIGEMGISQITEEGMRMIDQIRFY